MKNLLEEFAIILLNTATFELEMMLHHGIQEHNINCTGCTTCWAHSWSSISNVWRSIKALIPGLYIQGGKAWNQGYMIIAIRIIISRAHMHMYTYTCIYASIYNQEITNHHCWCTLILKKGREQAINQQSHCRGVQCSRCTQEDRNVE